MNGTTLLTIGEAAELVGVTERTVRRWVAAGQLKPAARMGRACLYLDREVYEAEKAARCDSPPNRWSPVS